MGKRININDVEPKAVKAMYALVGYLHTVKLSKTSTELMKIRASQINRCANCIDMHAKEALKIVETNPTCFFA